MTINHLWTKARIREIKKYNYHIKEIALVDYPEHWPNSGFQLGVIHLSSVSKGHHNSNNIIYSDIKYNNE